MRSIDIDESTGYNELEFEVSGGIESSVDDIIHEMMVEYVVDNINVSKEQSDKFDKLQKELTNLIMDVIQNK